ncbi:hypothetical protein [Methylobacterium nigriterrae]
MTSILALMTVGADITEAKQRLWRHLDELKDLRCQQQTLEATQSKLADA